MYDNNIFRRESLSKGIMHKEITQNKMAKNNCFQLVKQSVMQESKFIVLTSQVTNMIKHIPA